MTIIKENSKKNVISQIANSLIYFRKKEKDFDMMGRRYIKKEKQNKNLHPILQSEVRIHVYLINYFFKIT